MGLNFLAYLIRIVLLSSVVATIVLFAIIFNRSGKSLIKYLLCVMLVGIAGWSVGLYSMIVFKTKWATTVTFAFPLLALFGQIGFTKVFPENKLPKKFLSYWPILPMLSMVVASFFPDTIFPNVRIIKNYYIQGDNGTLGGVYSLTVTFFIIYSLYLLIRKTFSHKKYNNIIQMQLRYLTLAFIVFFIINVLTNSILPVFFGIYFFNGIGPVFSLLLVGIILYIISKYKFLDIKYILQRSLIYSLSLSVVVGFYLVLIFILGLIMPLDSDLKIILAAGVTTLIGIYTVPKIEIYFQKITDKIFYKNKYDFSSAINKLSEVLNNNIVLQDLLSDFTSELNKILKLKSLKILLVASEEIFDKNKFKPVSEKFPPDLFQAIEEQGLKYLDHSEIDRHIEQDKKFAPYLNMARELGHKYKIEVSVPVYKDNRVVAMLFLGEKLSGDIFFNDDFSLVSVISSQLSVALERARLYQEVNEYSQDLEKKVEDRTRKIKDLQVIQKQDMMEIAHGLQTPLTIVRGEIEILKKEIPDSRKLDVVETSIEKLSRFIYDLLSLYRLDEFDVNLKKDKLNLSELTDDLKEYYEVVAREKKIKILGKIEPDIYFYSQKNMLETVINNLVSNSIKYIGEGKGKKIEINLFKKDNKIYLEVIDNGIGISQADQKHLFEKFYRAHKQNNAHIRGTGLGLAICRKIVSLHKGKITLESEINKGTKFTIEFSGYR